MKDVTAGFGGGDAKGQDCSSLGLQVYRGVLGFEVSGLGFSGFGV